MATDLERLVVQLSADFKKYENALNKAMGATNRQARSIERRFQQMNRNIASGFNGLGASITKAFAVVGGVRGMQTLLDSATRIDNALKVAGLSGAELERVYGRLRDMALKNAAPLETMVELYSRLKLVQGELNISGAQLEQFVGRIGVALRVNGKSAAETAGAMIQLSQALGSGIVRAEEFNSIQDGALPILQAVAAGLKEAGGSVARLRQLVVDGKLSSEAFFRAFEAGSVILEDKVAGATLTTEQGITNLKTAMIDAMREFAHGTLAAESLGQAFAVMADKINSIDFKQFGEQVRELLGMIDQIRQAISWLQGIGANIGAATGLDAVGDWVTGGAARQSFLGGAVTITNQRGIQRRIEDAFGNAVETAAGLTEDAVRRAAGTATAGGKTGRLSAATVNPVSIEDYAAPSSKKGGGGGRSARERAEDYERLAKRIADSTAALVSETEVQRQLNPLVDDYGYAVERARTEQELLNAALAAGKTITPELREQIAALADQYALATVEAAKLAESQDRVQQHAEEMRDLQKDVLRGIVDGFIEGKKAADIFADALRKIGNKLLDIAFNNLFDPKAGGIGGSGGLFGGNIIPGILHSGGVAGRDGYGHGRSVSPSVFVGAKRYHKGGVAGLQPGEVPAILQRGEVVLPRGASLGGSVTAPVNINIDARGADREGLARVEQQVEKLKRELPATVVETVRKAQKSNVKLG